MVSYTVTQKQVVKIYVLQNLTMRNICYYFVKTIDISDKSENIPMLSHGVSGL